MAQNINEIEIELIYEIGMQGHTPYVGANGNWFVNGVNTGHSSIGADGETPHIGTNNNWFIGDTDTGIKAVGVDGKTPYVGANKNWFINGVDTGIKAEGKDGSSVNILGQLDNPSELPLVGNQGDVWMIDGNLWVWASNTNSWVDVGRIKGEDGAIPYIGGNGNWWINGVDTGMPSQGRALTWNDLTPQQKEELKGQDGVTPHIGFNLNWWIGNTDTGIKAQGQDGEDGADGVNGVTPNIGANGNWFIGSIDTGVKAEGKDGRGIVSVVKTSVVGTTHTFTITYTDGTTSTFTIDVPNGGGGSANPDNEYIALDSNNNLTFADKVTGYDADEIKVVHIKKGAVLNTAFFIANTRYVIKYKHNLGGRTIAFPLNVTLDFQGGRFENGTLTGNRTTILASQYLIFKDITITRDRIWNVDVAHSDWFNCAKDGYIIDYKTMRSMVTGTDVPTGVTTADVPLLPNNVLPYVHANNNIGNGTGMWHISTHQLNLTGKDTIVPIKNGGKPTLKLAPDGVTYLFAQTTNLFFTYNSVDYPVAQYTNHSSVTSEGLVTLKPDGTPFTDDTYKLNQLLKLKARHTIIGNEGEIFMIRANKGPQPDSGQWTNDNTALKFRDDKNFSIEINGILKIIPNNWDQYAGIYIYMNYSPTITGKGGVHGDLQEHLYYPTSNGVIDFGEGGHCINIAASRGGHFEEIQCVNAFGDGMYVSFNKWSSASNESDFYTFKKLRMFCNRRTGIGYEKGNLVTFDSCEFDGYRNVRGTATYAAIDIEPFDYGSSPIRNIEMLVFKNNIFRNYLLGPALRIERGIGTLVEGNWFYDNAVDIFLCQTHQSSVDITNELNRTYRFGSTIVRGNNSRNCSDAFIEGLNTSNSSMYVTAHIYDNTLKDCHKFLKTMMVWDIKINDNTFFSLKKHFLYNLVGNRIVAKDNVFNHVVLDQDVPKYIFQSSSDTFGWFLNTLILQELTIDNFKFRDFSTVGTQAYTKAGTPHTTSQTTLFENDKPIQTARKSHFGYRVNVDKLDITNFKFNKFTMYPNSGYLLNSTSSIYSNVYNTYHTNELPSLEKLVIGDRLINMEQTGIVTTGAFINIPEDAITFEKNTLTTPIVMTPQTMVVNSAKTMIAVANPTLLTSGSYTLPVTREIWNPKVTSDFTYFELGTPIIKWEGIGRVANIASVTLYNSKGRRVLETSTGIIWEYDGTRFVNYNAKKVGLIAERPLKATLPDGFVYFDTEAQKDYIYQKSIDDWIEKP